MENMIGQRVTIQCPVFKRGRKFRGVITGEKIPGVTALVLIDGNKKAKGFAFGWLTKDIENKLL